MEHDAKSPGSRQVDSLRWIVDGLMAGTSLLVATNAAKEWQDAVNGICETRMESSCEESATRED